MTLHAALSHLPLARCITLLLLAVPIMNSSRSAASVPGGKLLVSLRPSVMTGNDFRLPAGMDIQSMNETRLSVDELPGGGAVVWNRSDKPGGMRVRLTKGMEPYVFERGREERLWRVLSPISTTSGEGFEYRLKTGTAVEVWPSEAFAAAHPESPYREMTRLGLHLDLASEFPGEEPRQWRVYPDGSFPLRVTLRNTGRTTLEAGEAELWAPEGWGKSQARLFRRLRPGGSARAMLTVRPGSLASIGQSAPAFVFVRFRPAGSLSGENGQEGRISFQNSVDLLPVRPLETRFTFGERGETTLHLKNLFPHRTLRGRVSIRTAEGRTINGGVRSFRVMGSGETRLAFRQHIPVNEPVSLRRTYATITVGGYRQLASGVDTASITLGAANEAQGVEWISAEDGRTEPVQGANAPALRAIPHLPGALHYTYFNVTSGFPAEGNTYVQVEYLDEGSGSMRLQYDSTDTSAAQEGRFKETEAVQLTGSGTWKTYTWKLTDANFEGRQSGAADFRIELGPEPLVIRRVSVSKWPL